MSARIVYPVPIRIQPFSGANKQQIGSVNAQVKVVQPEEKTQYKDPYGRVTDKGSAFAVYEAEIGKQNNQIITHENDHKIKGGPQSIGDPVYQTVTDKDGRKIIVGGHQMIAVPAAATKNDSVATIEKKLKAAEYVIAGSEAPSDGLSDADKNIAEKGRALVSTAKTAKQEKEQFEQDTTRSAAQSPEGVSGKNPVQNLVNWVKSIFEGRENEYPPQKSSNISPTEKQREYGQSLNIMM